MKLKTDERKNRLNSSGFFIKWPKVGYFVSFRFNSLKGDLLFARRLVEQQVMLSRAEATTCCSYSRSNFTNASRSRS